MIAFAEIFRRYGPAYRAKFGNPMPPSHRKVMADIDACRTEALGGHVFLCEPCQEQRYSYHSCQHRHGPTCQHDNTEAWLRMQNALLVPVTYFMVTFDLPAELRELARRSQKTIDGIFFRTSAAALQRLARDRKLVGGQRGFLGVLQTWTRALRYHPHIHDIVAGGGLSADGSQWRPAREDVLVPVKALSKIFRAKFRDALKKTPLDEQVPPETWEKAWVVHGQPVGAGQQALKSLAPSIFRVAIRNQRILQLEDGKGTVQYKAAKTDTLTTQTLLAEEFIRRFLPHGLPNRFINVRYQGFLSSRTRQRLEKVNELLHVKPVDTAPPTQAAVDAPDGQEPPEMRCPKCGSIMRLVGDIAPTRFRLHEARASP